MSKMQGISVQLPLFYGANDGPYKLNKDLGQVVRQNLKNLLLTSPGERVMVPTFGAGLHEVLFQNKGDQLYNELNSRIYSQTKRWMPFIILESVEFRDSSTFANMAPNELSIIITFSFGSLNQKDVLKITLLNN
jgi:phage baseplate assembly protein W